jgi:hypothetical protein
MSFFLCQKATRSRKNSKRPISHYTGLCYPGELFIEQESSKDQTPFPVLEDLELVFRSYFG